jgi:hypothetical protein
LGYNVRPSKYKVFGIDPEWIYEKVGFDPDILQIPNGRLSVPQVNDMMNETIKS